MYIVLSEDIKNIENFYLQEVLDLYIKRKEKEVEYRQWQLYLTIFPSYDKKSYVSYEDFLNKMKKTSLKKVENKTFEEIFNKSQQIKDNDKREFLKKGVAQNGII